MVDRYLAWLNCNIELLDERSKNAGHNSIHDKRRCRYKRDILQEAREQYLKNSKEKTVETSEAVKVVNSSSNRVRFAGRPPMRPSVKIRRKNVC